MININISPDNAKKIRLDRPLVVEGKYDKIKLSNIISSEIIITEGFHISGETNALIKAHGEKSGVYILTDSDDAGRQIRSKIREIAGGNATDLYAPAIPGKERRKTAPGKAGLLGIEGISDDILIRVFTGVQSAPETAGHLTRSDLFDLKLTGAPNAAERRKTLLTALGLPPNLSSKQMLGAINTLVSQDALTRALRALPLEFPPAGKARF